MPYTDGTRIELSQNRLEGLLNQRLQNRNDPKKLSISIKEYGIYSGKSVVFYLLIYLDSLNIPINSV